MRKEDYKAEYRNAFLKKLMGQELNENEKRAFTQSGVNGVIPEETANEIIKKVIKLAPVLNEITLLNVKGAVKFAIEGTKTGASIHTENATINGDADTLVTITLGTYEITKLVQISKSVSTMTVSAFEQWLTDMISEKIAEKIEDLIYNGTGSSQPKGILAETFEDGKNAVKIAKTGTSGNYALGTYTADDIRKLVALLGAGYDANAKMHMNKKTLFTDLMPLQDNAKHDLVREINGVFYVYGYPVKLTDKLEDGTIILGDFKKYVGNLAVQDELTSQFDIDTNSFKYLGCALFDGKVALLDGFVKAYKEKIS